MFCLTVKIEVQPEKLKDALDILRFTIEPTKAHYDCVTYYAGQDIMQRNIIWLHQIWKNKESFESQMRSDEFHSVLNALELAKKKPEVNMYTISASEEIMQFKDVVM